MTRGIAVAAALLGCLLVACGSPRSTQSADPERLECQGEVRGAFREALEEWQQGAEYSQVSARVLAKWGADSPKYVEFGAALRRSLTPEVRFGGASAVDKA